MLMLAITNLVTQSQSSYPNNKFMSCLPNEKGLIPLGQENFTQCLQQNPSGKYVLVSPIHFSHFSDEEKMLYPMYNFSSPFTGALDTGDHYIADLYLNRIGMSALFGVIANSTFHIRFKNPYVMGTNHTAVLAAMARDHNTINMTVDHATAITICPPNMSCDNTHHPYPGATAIVLGYAQDSNLSIFFMGQSTHTKTVAPYATTGIVVGRLEDSAIDMNVNTHFSQLTSSGNYSCVGAVGYHHFKSCRLSCNYFFKAQTNFNNISIFSGGNFSVVGSTVGGLYGHEIYDTTIPVNKINSKINTITIHSSGQHSVIGACVGVVQNCINTLHLNVHNAHIITSNKDTHSALAIGFSLYSNNTVYANVNTFILHNTGDDSHTGGIVGHILGGFPISLQGQPSPSQFQAPSNTITANVGKVLIHNTGKNSLIGIMVGVVSLKEKTLNLWLQGGQINISTNARPSALAIGSLENTGKGSGAVVGNVVATVHGQPSAIGVGYVGTLSRSQNLAISFVAGQAELSDPAFILQPGTCPYSLVDQSGINVNIDTLGCQNARVVHSIEPHGWRSAMKQLQPILCPSQSQHLSCHYLNEQPIALAAMPSSNMFYLVSQQRYPYNRSAEHDALIRVTGLQLLSHQFNPSIDPFFGSNGMALYSPNNDTLLLPPPHSVNVDGDNLYHLYKDSDQPVLAHFKLNHTNDVYHRNPLVTNGDVIQLDQGGVWLQRNHLLEHYIIDPTTLILNHTDQVIQLTTDSIDVSAPVIGVQFFGQDIYVARLTDNNTTHPDAQATILYEQYPVNNHASTMWNETVYGNFSNVNQYTMQVIMNSNGEAFIALLSSTDLLINNNCSEVVVYTADLMPQGGPAKWRYSKPSIFAVHSSEFGSKFGSDSLSHSGPKSCLGPSSWSGSIPTPTSISTSTPPPPAPKKLNLTFVLATSASAVLTCTGLITIGTCILCRKKSCSCSHKSKFFHINKEENSRITSAIDELFSPSSWDERDPLLIDKQRKSATTTSF